MTRKLIDSVGGVLRFTLALSLGLAVSWSTASAAQHLNETFGYPSLYVPGWLVTGTLVLGVLCMLAVAAYLAVRLLELAMRLRAKLAEDAWTEVRRVAEAAPDCETAERWLGGAERLTVLSRRAGLPVGNCQAWLSAVQATIRQQPQ